MATIVSTAQNSTSFAQIAQNFTNYIVSPLNAFGLGGFVFDIEGETNIQLHADITDHFIEDNSTVQDNISIRPQIVTLKSFVGEVVYQATADSPTTVQKVVQKLTILSQYLPILSQQSQQVQQGLNIASKAFTQNGLTGLLSSASGLLTNPGLNNVANLWALTKNLNPAATKQQQAYLYFKALYEQKILVGLQTPFEFITNMAIQNIAAVQDEITKYMSTFSITLKKIRVASTGVIAFNPQQYQPIAAAQVAPAVQQGNNQGTDVPIAPIISPFKM